MALVLAPYLLFNRAGSNGLRTCDLGSERAAMFSYTPHEFTLNGHRRYLRVPLRRPILYRVIDSIFELEELTNTSNVSLSGCRFVTTLPIPVESLLELRLSIPLGVVSADASVMFQLKNPIMGYTVGVHFIRLLPGDRSLLEEAIPGLRASEVEAVRPLFREFRL